MISINSLIYVKNKSGPNPLPWITPLTSLAIEDIAEPILVWWVRPHIKLRNQFNKFPPIPYDVSLVSISFFCETVSKALLKSIYTIVTPCLSLTDKVQSFRDSNRLVHVELPLTKPCCALCIILFCWKKLYICRDITRSIILQGTHVKDIGL